MLQYQFSSLDNNLYCVSSMPKSTQDYKSHDDSISTGNANAEKEIIDPKTEQTANEIRPKDIEESALEEENKRRAIKDELKKEMKQEERQEMALAAVATGTGAVMAGGLLGMAIPVLAATISAFSSAVVPLSILAGALAVTGSIAVGAGLVAEKYFSDKSNNSDKKVDGKGEKKGKGIDKTPDKQVEGKGEDKSTDKSYDSASKKPDMEDKTVNAKSEPSINNLDQDAIRKIAGVIKNNQTNHDQESKVKTAENKHTQDSSKNNFQDLVKNQKDNQTTQRNR